MTSAAPNADPAELAKFSALAQSWWDPNGPSKPLHDLNPLRLEYIDRAVSLSGKLDPRCRLRRGHPLRVDGAPRCSGARHRPLAAGPRGCRTARPRGESRRSSIEALAAEELALERPAAFDAVTCMEMLEHVPEPAAALAALGASGEARRRCHRVDLESHARRRSPLRSSGRNGSRAFCPAARTST